MMAVIKASQLFFYLCFVFFFNEDVGVLGLGSMSSIAASYGANGPVFCGLDSDGSHFVSCFGADDAIVYGAPFRLQFFGLAAGDGFVCGLLLSSLQPYCWGSDVYINLGTPSPIAANSSYSHLSAGDHHLCALRHDDPLLVDCWGYNMTSSVRLPSVAVAISAGSNFNCALLSASRSVFCWGDDTASDVFKTSPSNLRFRSISAGGFHVCGILENSQVFCWGNSLPLMQQTLFSTTTSTTGGSSSNIILTPMAAMSAVVGGRFHACGIKSEDREVLCWGYSANGSLPPPSKAKVYELVAGDYFTCGVLAENSLRPICWGSSGPWSIPMAVSPGICISVPCGPGYYEFRHASGNVGKVCKPADSRVCLPCSTKCPTGTYESLPCSGTADRRCDYNCSSCSSSPNGSKTKFLSFEIPIFVAELVFAVVLVTSVSLVAFIYVRHKLRHCKCSANQSRSLKSREVSSTSHKILVKVTPDVEELKIRRPRMFTYQELERATGGFKEESQVGKGSFSCVFKGVLNDGTTVAVKRAIVSSGMKKNYKEFHTELDLLSRLNHAHLLNLLGYCEDDGERLLVYEFMAHGSLYQHLHGKNPSLREKLDWVRRVTIAVQAARGIEYLHGYACPPVIHRDIKSSNILIDEEQNARVADFGLSLLGPVDSSSPLSELPAGTLGYLDPEYYRLHYLTTKSDVYSFGVLLLEILSGRKAIDMQFDEGNIVEWAVPLIRAGNISALLDPVLKPPDKIESLKKIAAIACKCVRMRGKDRPSMDKVTTALEQALALLMGSPCNDQPILPTEVVLGSSRLHNNKSSQRSSNQSCFENDVTETEDQRFEFRAPSWITFPSVTSSQRRKSSASEGDLDAKNLEGRIVGTGGGDVLRRLEEEIGPASPQEDLYLQHNF